MTLSPLRSAAVIAVGTELLGSTRLDTNSLFIASCLAGIGVELRVKSVVGDSRAELASLFAHALGRADLVVLTGGLGPTEDDVTREVVAEVLGLPLDEDAAILGRIRARFASRGLTMPDLNRRQAMVPRGGTVLQNPLGTAPGLLIEHGPRIVVLLPGPPRELQPMFEALVSGPLAARASGERLYQTSLFVVGQSESRVDELAQPVYSPLLHAQPAIETTILATPGQIELHLTTRAVDAETARLALGAARDALLAVLGDGVFSTEGQPLEAVVGALLLERRLRIAAAESCTGGLFLSRLTDVPGSSAYVMGGVVAYANELKRAFADVPPELIERHGAVSEPVATAMAEGIRDRTGADIGVGITGIAGPGGGTPEKPVGTVAIAIASGTAPTWVRTVWVHGGRPQIKFNSTQTALDMVRRLIAGRLEPRS